MLIKSERFVQDFLEKSIKLKLNYNAPLIWRGSYKNKPIGSFITDIDLAQNVYLPKPIPSLYHNFVYRIYSTILNARKENFIFLRLSCGTYNEFKLPWNIDDKGGCDYSVERTELWLKKISKIIPKNVYESINKKLNGDISIDTLYEVRAELRDYSEILWDIEDLWWGEKTFRGVRYSLVDLMREGHITIIRYLYKYGDDFCGIDFSLVDRKYIKQPNVLSEYYTHNSYKIFKSLKWYVKKEYFQEYVQYLNSMEKLPALLNKFSLYDTAKKFKVLTEGELSLISKDLKGYDKQNLKQKLNKKAEKGIELFKNKIIDSFVDTFQKYLERAEQGRVKISKLVLMEREIKGYKCPFFSLNLEMFNTLYTISKNYFIDFSLLCNCITKVSEKYGIEPYLLIYSIFNPDIQISVFEDEYYIGEKSFGEDLKKAQLYLFAKK
jgi:hypothetical protein